METKYRELLKIYLYQTKIHENVIPTNVVKDQTCIVIITKHSADLIDASKSNKEKLIRYITSI